MQLRRRPKKYFRSEVGKLVVSGSSQYVVLVELKTGEVLKYLHKEGKDVPVRHITLSKSCIFAAY